MDKPSKPISKVDEESKRLIIELLGGENTGGFDVDSIYNTKHGWIVIEFLKCDTVRPFDSHPNRYWFKNKQKFISLWQLTQKLCGRLFLLNYEESREQFLLIEVVAISESGITQEQKTKMTFEETKKWFKAVNNHQI